MQRRVHPLLALGIVAVSVVGTVLFLQWLTRPGPRPDEPPTSAKRCEGRYELAILNGLVLDGLGSAPVRADVGVNGGRIVCVGRIEPAEAQSVIDAAGLTVAPGFIDVHTHVERNLPTGAQPFAAASFLRQGVTTIITGNCGRSAVPLGAMFAQLEKNGTQLNVAALVGHNSVRLRVMGESRRAPTPGELAEMQKLVTRAMDDGALGLSTGLVYEPGKYSHRDELVALARAAAARGGLYVTHLRDEAAEGVPAIREAIEIGEAAAAAVHISHFKAQGPRQWGTADLRLGIIDEARRRNLRVTIDQYPYVASSTSLELLLPDGARAQTAAQLRQSLQHPQERARLRDEMLAMLHANGWQDFSFARVAYCPSNLSLNGLSAAQLTSRVITSQRPSAANRRPPPTAQPDALAEENFGAKQAEPSPVKEPTPGAKKTPDAPAKEPPAPNVPPPPHEPPGAGVKQPPDVVMQKVALTKAPAPNVTAPAARPESEVERQAEAVLELLANGGAQMIYFDMAEPDVLAIMKHQDTMFGSDSGVRLDDAPAVPHPRGSGTFPRVLSHYVRDLGLLSLPEAVRRMTSLPAQTFGLNGRGQIREGFWADLVIFDPLSISDRATYEDPLLSPKGISYVIVNGGVVIHDGQITKALAGTALRR
jgi:N-acyl-D-aspartate/D-glutamate deacylase